MKYFLLFFSIFIFLFTKAQNPVIDSLLTKVRSAKADTATARNLVILSNEFSDMGMYDTAIHYAQKAFEMAEDIASKTKDPKTRFSAEKSEANALNNMGLAFANTSEYDKALKKYFQSLKIRERIGESKGIAGSYNNIGNIYLYQKQDEKALGYYFDALKMNQKLDNKKWMAINYNNIGFVYADEQQWDKALENFLVALKINEELNDQTGLSVCYTNLADYYRNKSQSASEKNNEFLMKQDIAKASDYYHKALVYYEQFGYKDGICAASNSLGILSSQQGKYDDALAYFQKGLSVASEIGDHDELMSAYNGLTNVYAAKKDYQNAFKYNQLTGKVKDSIYNKENSRQIAEMSAKYETEKKEEQITLLQKDKEIQFENYRRQKVVRNSFIAGFILLLLFGGFIYNRYKISRKQNGIIEMQKQMVEEKQKEIVDSITYAKRIQYTLLAHEGLLKKNLSEYFVLFKPKDIVSGDFYWATEKDGLFYLAVCDSTGHGVPGAFMSLLNISFLNEAINEKNIREPHMILNHVRKRLVENISQHGGQDGMDAILICFDRQKENITYAAANNSPVLVRANEAIFLGSDKMPVGKGERSDSFSLRTMTLQKEDMLFVYTDGYADQFGGDKGKKFKSKKLNELLISIHQQPAEAQRQKLDDTLEAWKGPLEQVDDICIMGIRI